MLTIEEARQEAEEFLASVSPPQDAITFRSCWNCNSAHEYLKKAEYIICCFACGGYFWKGIDITEWEEE